MPRASFSPLGPDEVTQPSIISQILTNLWSSSDCPEAKLLRSSTRPAPTEPFLSWHSEATGCSSGPSAPLQRNKHARVGQSRKNPGCSCHTLTVSKLQLHRLSAQPLTWAPDSHLSLKKNNTLERCGRLCGNCCQIQETILSVRGNKLRDLKKEKAKPATAY